MNHVTVIGSINLDTTLRVKEMPKPGETIHAIEHFTAGGGKGANQGVASKRSGANTSFIGAIGNDAAGRVMFELLEGEEINVSGIKTIDNESTGQAFITVDESGENSIMIYAGANNHVTENLVEDYKQVIETSDFLIAQFESAISGTIRAFQLAKEAGVKTILNPAPAVKNISDELLKLTDIIIPNETETELITGISLDDDQSIELAAKKLQELGVELVIITLGSRGPYYNFGDQSGFVSAYKVKAVDTTAAGDTFIGAFASQLEKDFSNIEEAIDYGNKASSLTVQRYGAQPSIPFENEIKEIK